MITVKHDRSITYQADRRPDPTPIHNLLLQTRTRTLDGTLRPLFERWHPGLANDNPASAGQAAAA